MNFIRVRHSMVRLGRIDTRKVRYINLVLGILGNALFNAFGPIGRFLLINVGPVIEIVCRGTSLFFPDVSPSVTYGMEILCGVLRSRRLVSRVLFPCRRVRSFTTATSYNTSQQYVFHVCEMERSMTVVGLFNSYRVCLGNVIDFFPEVVGYLSGPSLPSGRVRVFFRREGVGVLTGVV